MRSLWMIFALATALVTFDRARADEPAVKAPTTTTTTTAPAAAALAPLTPDEQKLVGLWSVDVEATWAGVLEWAKANPGEAADRISKPETRMMFQSMASVKPFQLRADRRWIPMSGRGESTQWTLTGDTLSGASKNAPRTFRERKVVGQTLVEYEGSLSGPGVIYTRADLNPTPALQALVGEWAIEPAAARAMAKRLDDSSAAMSPGGKTGQAAALIETLLPSRLNLFDDGTAELTAGPDAPAKAYTWRSDGDLVIIEPKEPGTARITLLLWTPTGLVGTATDPMPVSVNWQRVKETPTKAVPAAPKGN